MEEEIGDIGSEHLVIEPTPQQMEALNLLYTSHEIDRELASIAFRYRQDKDDLRQLLALKLTKKGYALRHIKCVKSWCHVTAKNLCIDRSRTRKHDKRYREAREYESVKCKRGGEPIFRSPVETPEEQMLELEQESARDSHTQELRAHLRESLADIISSLPEDVLEIVLLWAEQKTAKEIASIVGKSLPTVYRKLKEFEKEIVEKCDMAAAATDETLTCKQLVTTLRPLISDGLRASPNSP